MSGDKQMAQTGAAGNGSGHANLPAEGRVLIHLWQVLDPAQADMAVQHLDTMLSAVAADPGFVAADLLETGEQDWIAVVIEMRSLEDRRRLETLPEVRQTIERLQGTVNVIVKLYNQIVRYRA